MQAVQGENVRHVDIPEYRSRLTHSEPSQKVNPTFQKYEEIVKR